MNCFNHADKAAVGTCKACHKGLCAECAVDLGFGLSCRGPHEQRVAEVEELISRNASVQRVAGGAKYAVPAFYLFMGLVFAGYGLFFARSSQFLVILGIGFIAFGIYVLFANRRAFGSVTPAPDTSRDAQPKR